MFKLSCKREAPDTDFLVPEAAFVRKLWKYCRNNHKNCKINLASFNARTHTHKKEKEKEEEEEKNIYHRAHGEFYNTPLCLSVPYNYYLFAFFVSLVSLICFRFFFLPFFRSFDHSFLLSFLDRNIYLKEASSIGTLRHEIFSLDMEKGSKSQTLVWCENCTEKFTKSRDRRNCQSNGWLLNLFSSRFSLLRAMCKYVFLVLTELSYSFRVSNKYWLTTQYAHAPTMFNDWSYKWGLII